MTGIQTGDSWLKATKDGHAVHGILDDVHQRAQSLGSLGLYSDKLDEFLNLTPNALAVQYAEWLLGVFALMPEHRSWADRQRTTLKELVPDDLLMVSDPLSAERRYTELLLELHVVAIDHGNDSAEADAVRDQMDEPGRAMNAESVERVNALATMLNAYELTL